MKQVHKIVNTIPLNSDGPDFIEKINIFCESHKVYNIQFAHDNNGTRFREWAYITYEETDPKKFKTPLQDSIFGKIEYGDYEKEKEIWGHGKPTYESKIDAPDFERIVKCVKDMIFENYKENGNGWTLRGYHWGSDDNHIWHKMIQDSLVEVSTKCNGNDSLIREKILYVIMTASMMYEQSIRHEQSVRDE